MGAILYAAMIAHVVAYREQYMKIGVTVTTTMIVKLVIKEGSKDHATMVGYAGGWLTIGQFLDLCKTLTARGFTGGIGGANPSGAGLIPELLKMITGGK